MTRPAGRQLSLLLLIEGGAPEPAPPPEPLTDAIIAELFADWYRNYPRKRGPHHALLAFARVLRKGGATVEKLTEERDRYVEECRRKGTDPKYIKHPATWLNGGCWLDEQDAPAPLSRTASALARVASAIGTGHGVR